MHHDTYALNYREVATPFTPSEILAADEYKPLNIASVENNRTTELLCHQVTVLLRVDLNH